MAALPLSDNLGNSTPDIKIDISQPASLLNSLRAQVAHIIVVPDFLALAPQPLRQAAPNPVSFDLKLSPEIPLPGESLDLSATPDIEASIKANTTAGAGLFDDDPFTTSVAVPPQTGYVTLNLEGSLDLGGEADAGNVTFGLDVSRGAGIRYSKAFPLGGASEPTFGAAVSAALSDAFLPRHVDDLNQLRVNDIVSVSGSGSMEFSGGFTVVTAPNPLASLELPMGAGQLKVQAGVLTDVEASFTLDGAYQVRLRRASADVIELGVYQDRGKTLTASLTVSGGVRAAIGDTDRDRNRATDLITRVMGAISTEPVDDAAQSLFAAGGLNEAEIAKLADALGDAIDHSLAVSMNAALSQLARGEAALEFELRPAEMDEAAKAAVEKALRGNFSSFRLRGVGAAAAPLLPGVRLLTSVLTDTRKSEIRLRLNLFGLVNVLSIRELLRKSVTVTDAVTGEVTIADSATASRIEAIADPLNRHKTLRKVMFESLLATAAYRVSSVVEMRGLESRNSHFASESKTRKAAFAAYMQWFSALDLLTREEGDRLIEQFPEGGASTCLLRTAFDDDACQRLFFKGPNQLHDRERYLDLGRQALMAVLDPEGDDRLRYYLLEQHWQRAFAIGPVGDQLAGLVGLSSMSPNRGLVGALLVADVATVAWWADAMVKAGAAVFDMRRFLSTVAPGSAPDPKEFARRRDTLQKTLAKVMQNSQAEFGQPWGLIALQRAAGSPPASGLVVAGDVVVRRPLGTITQSAARSAT